SMTIFFFQAEDGIRDYKVTGVQTCALPISWFATTTVRQKSRCSAIFPAACTISGRHDRRILNPRRLSLKQYSRSTPSMKKSSRNGPTVVYARRATRLPDVVTVLARSEEHTSELQS